jgi:aspartate aminotransferase-like enzyme
MKNHMMTPGPTDVAAEVMLAGAMPQIHHRTPQFVKIYEEVHRLTGRVFKTTRPVWSISASGTGAMEAAVANLTYPGSRPIVIDSGWFGKRWTEISAAYGMTADVIEVPWGEAVDPGELEKRLVANPDCPAVFVQLVETATGGTQPVRELQEIVSATKTVLVVDAISGLGAEPCDTDAWRLDCVLTGAQKSLMIPPGLAFISVGPRCDAVIDKTTHPRFYFDLRKYKKGFEKLRHPFTPPTSLIQAQWKALQLLEAEGIDATVARHQRLARATRGAIEALGLELFAKSPGAVLTSVVSPNGLDSSLIVKKARDEYGLTIAGSQGPWQGKFFRIGHLGFCDDNDIILAVGAVERVLKELGVPITLGAGVARAQEILFDHKIRRNNS